MIFSPAKINLSLEILGRRDDGFHELLTIFQSVKLFDELEFNWNSTNTVLLCDHPAVPIGGDNLILKALKVAEAFLGTSLPVEIKLKKNIPMGAGLGGGSSNAASVLLELGRRFAIPEEALRKLASSLGADVAFFLKKGTALGKGKGEILEALPLLPEFPLVIVKPKFSIATPFAYSQIKEYSDGFKTKKAIELLQKKRSQEAFNYLINDFEKALFPLYPELIEIKKCFTNHNTWVGALSGSGSACFAITRDLKQSEALAKELNTYGEVWITTTG